MGFTVMTTTPPPPVTVVTTAEVAAQVKLLLDAGVPHVCASIEGWVPEAATPLLTFTGGKMVETHSGVSSIAIPVETTSFTVLAWFDALLGQAIPQGGCLLRMQMLPTGPDPNFRGASVYVMGEGAFSLHAEGQAAVFNSPAPAVPLIGAGGLVPLVITYDYAIDNLRCFVIGDWQANPHMFPVGDAFGLQMGTPSQLLVGSVDVGMTMPVRIGQVIVWNTAFTPEALLSAFVAGTNPRDMGHTGTLLEFDPAHADLTTKTWPAYKGNVTATLAADALLINKTV